MEVLGDSESLGGLNMIIIVPGACKAIINVLVLPGGRVYCTASLGGVGDWGS